MVSKAKKYLAKGIELVEKRNYQEAIEELKKSIKENPNEPNVYIYLAAAYNNLWQYEQSLTWLDRALLHDKKKEHYASIHFNRGLNQKKLKLYEESLESINKCLNSDPNRADAHLLKGNVLREQGKLVEALESLDEALKLKLEYVIAMNSKVELLRLMGKKIDAERLTNKIDELKLNSYKKTILDSLNIQKLPNSLFSRPEFGNPNFDNLDIFGLGMKGDDLTLRDMSEKVFWVLISYEINPKRATLFYMMEMYILVIEKEEGAVDLFIKVFELRPIKIEWHRERCAYCKTEIDDITKICSHCGKPLFCINCGAQIKSSGNYCGKCGAPLI